MSYSYKLDFKQIKQSELKRIVNSNSNVSNNLFNPSDKYHMNIDIENENQILFHIPYKFMEFNDINFKVYLEIIRKITEKVKGKTFDLQEEKYIDDTNYISPQPRKLKPSYSNRHFDKFIANNNNFTFYSDEEKSSLLINLNDYTIQNVKNELQKEKVYPPFSNLKRFVSENSNYIALRNWNEKSIRLYKKQNELKTDLEIWNIQNHTEIKKCGKVKNLVFESEKRILTTSYKSKTLKLWSLEDNKVIRNFSNYSNSIYTFHKVNDKLIFTLSSAGITFFDFETGKILLHIYPLVYDWICFDSLGNYDGAFELNKVYELNYVDNKNSESFSFIPNIGFATFRPAKSWKLYKLKKSQSSKENSNLIKEKLSSYLE